MHPTDVDFLRVLNNPLPRPRPEPQDPDHRPSAPPPPDVPDRSDPPEPIDRPHSPAEQPPQAAPWEVLLAMALLEDQAAQLRHFTVLDALLRVKRRFLQQAHCIQPPLVASHLT